jgi:signal transduction histidine kinase/CheY-like chemotaxis protein
LRAQIATVIANSRAYEESQKRAEALAEIDRVKTTFFSNVSHEFRTPLTLMLGPLEDLKSQFGRSSHALSVPQYQQVDLAHRNGLRLLKLVNTLLDFSRIEAGRVQAHYQPTDLPAFTAEIASVFRSATDKAGLRLAIDCPPLPEEAFVDREMWEKIVLNLVSNAFKFTFEGEIEVKLRAVDQKFELTVRDTGTGIPADELPKLFERFHRVVGARGRTHEGSGIGLALVQELARLHEGTVSAESRLGKGSTLRVTIPFGSRHLPTSQIARKGSQVSTTVGAVPFVQEALHWLPDAENSRVPADDAMLESANGRTNERTRILLADDNADMRAYVQRILSPLYEVEAVADGEGALAALTQRPPNLIVSDVMMPRLDGIELVKRVRADERMRTLPIILLSARAGEEAKEEGLAGGADEYLVKPFSARELLTRVSAAIELARTRSQSERFLHEEAQILELLNKVGTAVAAELDLERAVQVVTDAATELSGASFGSFFYNVMDEKGESYTLYTLSGAPRSAFAKFPMPRNTAVFGPTFSGEGIVRSDDITKDPRYGKNSPYRGMPEGHLPVRSYLAAPVKSRSGEVLGGLFFGHPDPGIFTDRAERIVSAIAVQAGIAMDKARLYRAAQDEIARRQQVEAQLRESEQTLESRVAERTDELMKTQAQLVQAQKMEGIGHLTGGVAHDFNNLLTIIIGNLETLRRVSQDPKTEPSRLTRSIENAMRGAERAAALTQRLLAFSRQQPLEPKVIEVNRLIAGMSDLLRRSLGEDVAIETVLAGGLWRVHVDANQLEVTLLNLAINARDAMPDGGKLTIETSNAALDEHYAASQSEVVAGQYVAICVTDTGRGMTQEIIERAFEPFFTTKDVGHGTGLGLSQVYGFVKQSGGHVKIYSEVDHGTTVKIYLPRLHAGEIETAPQRPSAPLARGQSFETILVVEDDPDVRNHTKEILGDLGYRTFEAGTGRAALQILSAHPEIKLLFTDVGLPGGMNGRELADEARRLSADIKVLMTTGYARNAIVHDGKLDPGVQLITKPFTYGALAAKIRGILDAPLRSGRVLLVEDEPLIRIAAAEQLEALGFKVETASTAANAISKLKLVGDVEAAIIDVGLPDRKGDVLVSEVRAIYPRMPIVIASGYAETALRNRFSGDTLVAFLGKPYTEKQLRSVLTSLNVGDAETE